MSISTFVSSGDVYDEEDNLTANQQVNLSNEQIACRLVEGGRKAVRCGGGYQVFQSAVEANKWARDDFS